MDISALVKDGGIFMVPLLLGSAVALGLAVERLLFFLSLEKGGPAFRESLLRQVRGGDIKDALGSLSGKKGIVPATGRAGLENWEQNSDVMEAAMTQAAQLQNRPLNRFLNVLETIVTAAPLIGLLGTITGMMGVFRVVALKLANDPHANTTGITAGIGEALIATATGILVAVLALLIHNSYQGWAEAQIDEAENLAAELSLAHRQQASRGG